jgi:hypothetical protein
MDITLALWIDNVHRRFRDRCWGRDAGPMVARWDGCRPPQTASQCAMIVVLNATRYDNAAVETFFKTIKAELIWRHSWETRRQAEVAIFEYINGFYNPRRRHSTLGWKSPVAFERKVA